VPDSVNIWASSDWLRVAEPLLALTANEC